MYKLVVLAALMAVSSAAPGLVAPLASPWGNGLVGGLGGHVVSAPVISAPIVRPIAAHVPVATSYANQVRIATPAVVAAPAIGYAHAPVVAASTYGHGW